jgi:predicted nucleic acid-binding protein
LNDILITDNELSTAINLVANIDENDALFVALNNRLSGFLWTGDKRLINGLRKKDYQNLITTDELFEIFLKKQSLNFRL